MCTATPPLCTQILTLGTHHSSNNVCSTANILIHVLALCCRAIAVGKVLALRVVDGAPDISHCKRRCWTAPSPGPCPPQPPSWQGGVWWTPFRCHPLWKCLHPLVLKREKHYQILPISSHIGSAGCLVQALCAAPCQYDSTPAGSHSSLLDFGKVRAEIILLRCAFQLTWGSPFNQACHVHASHRTFL